MTHFQFLFYSTAVSVGLIFIGFRYKAAGAFLVCWGTYMLLAFLPWSTINFLIKEVPEFRHAMLPYLRPIRFYWCVFSAVFTGWLGFLLIRFKPKIGKDPRWENPGEESGLDNNLKKALGQKSPSQSTFLGTAHGEQSVEITSIARESHMQIVGPTRSGKSQLLFALAAQDMRRKMPVFFMEAKGDYCDFDNFLMLADRCSRLADVWYYNPQDPRSMTMNPIRRLPGQDPTAISNQIAKVIGREPTYSGEGKEHFLGADFARVQTMAEVFWKTNLDFHLVDCYCYFCYPECREKAFRLCGDSRLARAARMEFERNPDVLSLTSSIRPWTTGNLGRLLNTYSPQITLDKVFTQNKLVYFAIPIGYLQVQANPLGRMVISNLLSIASWRQRTGQNRRPASVILDEFSEFATPVFASFIATVGSAKFWTVLSHQDLGQLKKVTGTDKESFESAVFNNTSGCKVCFRTPDPEDAEYWSRTMGTFSTHEDTERVQRGFLGEQRTGEMSRRAVEHFKIHPNRLKNLQPGTAFAHTPGQEPCLTRTARVYKMLEGVRVPELPLAEGDTREGLNLEKAIKQPTALDAAVGADGVKQ